MNTRRIQSIGDRSFSVTLPKQWILKNKIKSKTPVTIDETKNGDLIITSSLPKKISSEVTMNLDEVRSIQERIVYSYISNADKIILKSKQDISLEARKLTKKIVEQLEGFKVTDEMPRKIEISFIFKDINVNLPSILRRMIYLLKLMHESLLKKDREMVLSSELSIDRLYHLSGRIISNCLHNAYARQVNEIQSQEELFYFKDIVRRIEVIADRIVFITEDSPQPKDLAYLEEMISILDKLVVHSGDHYEAKQQLLEKNYKARDRGVDIRLRRIHDLSIDIVDAVMNIRFSREIN